MPRRSKPRLTQEDFLTRSSSTHGTRYDYSSACYRGGKKNVDIICPVHGLFQQFAGDHMRGSGCPQCGVAQASTSRRVGLEAFIKRALEAHPNANYDYSLVRYTNGTSKVSIGCTLHGVFSQTPKNHMRGDSCPKCGYDIIGDKKRKGLTAFIEQARAVHGSVYGYELVNYKGKGDDVQIICPTHGVFNQTPATHLRAKYGCPKCASSADAENRTYDTNKFVMLAQSVHAGRGYDYSQVIYNGSKIKVRIICPRHGSFDQAPDHHLMGKGCSGCVGRIVRDTPTFIAGARQVHGEKYDYTKSLYAGGHTKIVIICPTHGAFAQTPGSHMAGNGCPVCGAARTGLSRLLSKAEFIQNSETQHGKKYDYSQAVYVNCKLKLTIICPKHGAFEQTPDGHTSGNGCPACGWEQTAASSRLSWVQKANGRTCCLYFLKFIGQGEVFYKVGITVKTVSNRYKTKDSLQGYSYEVLAEHTSINAAAVYDWEQSIIETFAHLRPPSL